jgi:hypothetical protein
LVVSTLDEKDYLEVTIYGFPWFVSLENNYFLPGYQLRPRVLPKQALLSTAIKALE